mgnify:CR=1 FL=1
MKGGELQDYIADYERLTEAEARLFMRQILSALVHLHEKSIVHLVRRFLKVFFYYEWFLMF